jgi:hypothetical protein
VCSTSNSSARSPEDLTRNLYLDISTNRPDQSMSPVHTVENWDSNRGTRAVASAWVSASPGTRLGVPIVVWPRCCCVGIAYLDGCTAGRSCLASSLVSELWIHSGNVMRLYFILLVDCHRYASRA